MELSESNHRIFWVPEGFAHGFFVLSDYADFLYKCTEKYSAEHEQSIRWDDPTLAINWPLIDGCDPVVSEKDANGLLFSEAPCFS